MVARPRIKDELNSLNQRMNCKALEKVTATYLFVSPFAKTCLSAPFYKASKLMKSVRKLTAMSLKSTGFLETLWDLPLALE